ncbi:hypothetical protein GGS24DRAFT_222816 [Hypoxylon argillaceum]|nr:hypothetical protein GGS24DRAFT_222816 [Hypoxylon argillaceum]
MSDTHSPKHEVTYSETVLLPQSRNARESQLDPAYRISRRASAISRRRREEASRALILTTLFSSIIAYTALYTWPLLTSVAGHLAHYVLRVSLLSPQQQQPYPWRPAAAAVAVVDGDMEPFWHAHAQLMTATDHDTWFVNVDAASHAIAILWSSTPTPAVLNFAPEAASYAHTLELIRARAGQLDLARAEWEKFQRTRERLLADTVRAAAVGGDIYVDGAPISEAATLGKLWETINITKLETPAERRTREAEWEAEAAATPIDERGAAEVTGVARRVVEDLTRTYEELVKAWGPVQGHVQAALAAEEAFIERLCRDSSKKDIWTDKLAGALPALRERLEGIQRLHETMEAGLGQLQRQFPPERASEDKPWDKAAQLKSAKRLLRRWALALIDVEEGVLFLLRRRDLRGRRSVAETTWEAWKRRNCGGTSCYDAPTMVRSIAGFFVTKNPVAEVGRDEVNWAKRVAGDGKPRVWRSLYEKACCEADHFSHRLRYGLSRF